MKRKRIEFDTIKEPWILLYEKYKWRYRHEGNDRCFKAFAGVPMEVAEKEFQDYYHYLFLPTRDVLLLVLHFPQSSQKTIQQVTFILVLATLTEKNFGTQYTILSQ